MQDGLRKSGINIIGDVPWASHFCQFYQTGEDMLDILVPYFKAGLENNEACMWVTSTPLSVEEARQALSKVVPNLSEYINNHQLEIVPHSEWYMKDGYFDLQRVLNGWVGKLNDALARGYSGLRVTGNTAWLEKKNWQDFTDYEAAINGVIGKYRILALCTYSLGLCSAADVMDVMRNHEFALIKQQGKWTRIENAIYKGTKEALKESEERYRNTMDNMLEGCQMIGPDWRYLYVNDTVLKHGRTSREKLLGHTMMEAYPGIENTELFARLRNCMEQQVSDHMESEFIYPDGSKSWFDLSIQPVPEGIFILSLDITERKQAEAKLVHFASFTELNPMPVLELDSAGHILYINPTTKRIFPDLESAGLGHQFLAGLKPVLDSFSTGETTPFSREVSCGARYYNQVVSRVLEGQYVRIYASDITMRKQAEEELRKREGELSTILASVPVPVFVIDPERHVLNVNTAAAKFANHRVEEMLALRTGEALGCLHSMDDPRGCGFGPACQSCKTRLTVLDTFETGNNHYQVEWHIPISRGGKQEEINVLLSTVVLPTSKKQVLLCIEDITELKRAEQEIKRLNEGLQARAAELETANKELESFSSSVSHDLREPLRTIDGFSRILSKEYAGKLDDEGQRLLDTIRKGTEKMGQLISDLLAFSRLGRQHLKSSEVDMSELTKAIFDELKLTNTGRKLDIKIDILPLALGDRAMLVQVLSNLLSNAIKFTRTKDTATIEVGGSPGKTENVYHVKDNGVGFDMQYAGKLFNIFQRLHTQEEFEGTGVGLAIVQRIVHRHGGRVWVESKLNEGATFYFTLPRKGY